MTMMMIIMENLICSGHLYEVHYIKYLIIGGNHLHKHVKRFDQETVYPLPDLHNNRLYVNFFPVGATFKKSWKHTHPVGNKWI